MSLLKTRFSELFSPSGPGWGFLAFNIQAVFTPLTTLVLARFLMPEDLGLMTLASAVTILAEQLRNMGLKEALIREKAPSVKALSSCYWFLVGSGLFWGLVVFSLAPCLSSWLKVPELTRILRVVFLLIPLGGGTVVPVVLLIRNFHYQALFWREIFPFFGYFLLTLFLAWKGYRVWALVWGSLFCSVLRVLSFSLTWRPRAVFFWSEIRKRLPFGLNIFWQFLISWIYEHSLRLMMGRFWGPNLLGLFGLAFSLSNRPLTLFIQPLYQMGLPSLAQAKHEGRLAACYFLLLKKMILLIWAIALGLFFLLPLVVPSLLGAQWVGAVPLARFLLMIFALGSIGVLTSLVFQVSGRPNVVSKFLSLKTAIELPVFFWGIRQGVWPFLHLFGAFEVFFALVSLGLAVREVQREKR